jgi:hypothetical protein
VPVVGLARANWHLSSVDFRIFLPSKDDKLIQGASVTIQVGNGARTLFWTDRWLDGAAIASIAPDLLLAVHKNARKNMLVSEAIPNAQ